MSSPVITVMTAAVRKAARSLQRDYGELANLQVSQKAPGDYVTIADQKVDKMLREAHDLCLDGKFREAGDVVLHMGVETRMLQQTLKLMEDGPLARSGTS